MLQALMVSCPAMLQALMVSSPAMLRVGVIVSCPAMLRTVLCSDSLDSCPGHTYASYACTPSPACPMAHHALPDLAVSLAQHSLEWVSRSVESDAPPQGPHSSQ